MFHSSRIYPPPPPPLHIAPHHFQPKFLHRYFSSCIGPPTIYGQQHYPQLKLLHCKVSVVEWQQKNEDNVHRTAKDFIVGCKHICEWCVSAKAH